MKPRRFTAEMAANAQPTVVWPYTEDDRYLLTTSRAALKLLREEVREGLLMYAAAMTGKLDQFMESRKELKS